MNFIQIELGGPDTVASSETRFRHPFAFPNPVRTAYAALQSFHFWTDDSDGHVKEVEVVLTTHFDPVQSTTSGEVEFEITRTDASGNSFLSVESDTIAYKVSVLVIGI
jgi:hypothetical protein